MVAPENSLMDISPNESSLPRKIGDTSTSDVIVRIRTPVGRDDWIYCHLCILVKKSKYFADQLSVQCPPLDSRKCVEIYCEECDIDHHIGILRLFYDNSDVTTTIISSVSNALGILKVAVDLGCPEIVSVCVGYLEAVPWDETEEEEILKIIPGMGSEVQPILARLQPVNTTTVVNIFISGFQFAMSPSSMNSRKTSVQGQLVYMLTEVDDAPLLTADDDIKREAKQCVKELSARFANFVDSLSDPNESSSEVEKIESFQGYVSDLSWASQIMTMIETPPTDLFLTWVEKSESIFRVTNEACLKSSLLRIQLKVSEIMGKLLEAMVWGTFILPTRKRLEMVKLWLPVVRDAKSSVDSLSSKDDMYLEAKQVGYLWPSLELAYVNIIPTLPSSDQSEILTEWLKNKRGWYPDLSQAFEVWCYRSKVAKRRVALPDGDRQSTTGV